MSWKQFIPIEIDGLNPFETTVFQALLLRCANEQKYIKVADNNSYITLQRGQCCIGRFEFAKQFGLEKSECLRVWRIVDKLQKVNNLLNKQKSKNCSIVTILNYDSYVTIEQSNEQSVNNQRTISEQSVNTNNTSKSDNTSRKNKENTKEKRKITKSENEVESSTTESNAQDLTQSLAKQESPKPNAVAILLSDAEFKEAWLNFLAHRTGLGTQGKLSKASAEAKLKHLASRYTPKESVALLNYIVEQGWRWYNPEWLKRANFEFPEEIEEVVALPEQPIDYDAIRARLNEIQANFARQQKPESVELF